MKIWITVLCAVAVLFVGCAKPREVDEDLLQNRNDVYHLPNEEKPFTGVAVEKYENGQNFFEETYKDGKQHGPYTEWHKNGQKWTEVKYKDGKLHGLMTKWYENGQKRSEGTWKDDELISAKEWDRDGNPE
jgi:antitoxin component YwqK of YwqJK toxin-antitoxin module